MVDVIAMSDEPGYEYPTSVAFDIQQDDPDAYVSAAHRLNEQGYDLVHVQHEFGIFGGPAGSHLLGLVRELKMPIVTTLHTVLTTPSEEQRVVLEELIGLSQRAVVMTGKARELLWQTHRVPVEKITVIPHGIPDLPEESAESIKRSIGLEGRQVVLTFGLLSPDKGIEYAIDAMKDVPDAMFLIVGQTHPSIKRQFGEQYRELLVERAEKHGISDRVRFIDRFVEEEELCRLLKMTDVYVSPYLNLHQITSGTLAYTTGNGKAVVSTPSWHAQELLSDGRGMLVPPRSGEEIASAVRRLFMDPDLRESIEERAGGYGRNMRWPRVGGAHVALYRQSIADSNDLLKTLAHGEVAVSTSDWPPSYSIQHLTGMTDDVGILQHATYTIPNRSEGYCVDDNARALLAAIQLDQIGMPNSQLALMQQRYLAFCDHAFSRARLRFRNFMSYDRRWLDEIGSEDCHGRALWAMAVAAKRGATTGIRQLAGELYKLAAPAPHAFHSLRGWAYSTLGYSCMGSQEDMAQMVERLLNQYDRFSTPDWPWFEECLTYANARIPQALLCAGRKLGNQEAIRVGLTTLEWLCNVQTEGTVYCPIGNCRFYRKGATRSTFDQQPIEPAGHVSACLTAYRVTGDSRWRRKADWVFNWFIGANTLGIILADPKTGGCRDGLQINGANENQGAESTLSYLQALAEITDAVRASRRGALL